MTTREAQTGTEVAPQSTLMDMRQLPEAARRWLSHAIAPGAPLATSVQLEMHGQIRLGRWHPFSAVQSLTPRSGFIWSAHSRIGRLPVRGFDRYRDGAGEMRWRLFGLIPAMSARGVDVTRSAAGRLAAESIFVPTSLIDARWEPGGTTDSAVFWSRVGEYDLPVEIEVGPAGVLHKITLMRWGNPEGTGFTERRFTVTVASERHFGGMSIPNDIRAAWADPSGHDTDFFHATIDSAEFT
jgi:hypothetical protein